MLLFCLTKRLQTRFSVIGFFFLVTVVLVLFLSPKIVYSLDVTLTWDGNNEGDLAGYRIFKREYYEEKQEETDYTDQFWEGNVTTRTIKLDGTATYYYFVVRAFDRSGNESGNSNEVRYPPPENVPIKGSDQPIDTYEESSVCIIDYSGTQHDIRSLINVDGKKMYIQRYNKGTGGWISRYWFFGKLCGKDFLFQDQEFLYIFLLP